MCVFVFISVLSLYSSWFTSKRDSACFDPDLLGGGGGSFVFVVKEISSENIFDPIYPKRRQL